MSISTKLEQFRNNPRIVLNDKFIGDQGAGQLAYFISSHKGVISLQLKSNDISAQGFIPIFQALRQSCSQTLKQLNIEHNIIGANDYVQWHDALSYLIQSCRKLQRINLSNNRITGEGFSKIIKAIAQSKSLKLLQIKYNSVSNEAIQQFLEKLKSSGNSTLLYVEHTGNKIKREVSDGIQAILSKNRSKNPITKQKIMNVGGNAQLIPEADRTYNNMNRSHSVAQQMSYNEMTKYMQQILDQNRRQISQNKIKLQKQLTELQRRQKIDASDLNQLQKRCNQMLIVNRNLKFQLDRTIGQYQQIQRDQQAHTRGHEQKLRQGTKQVQNLQQKYQQIQSRMNKEHDLKMKQIVRDWQSRLRSVQQKIRYTQNDNNSLQNQIRKCMDKRQRLRVENIQQQGLVRSRIHEQQNHRFNFKIKDLQSKLRTCESSRDGYIRRNQELIYQLQKSNEDNNKQIMQLQEQLNELRVKQADYNAKNKDFFSKNEKVKSNIQMKQITIDKLQQQIQRLNKQIQGKKAAGEDEHLKIKDEHQAAQSIRQSQRQSRLERLKQAENTLKMSQVQNAKLRQQYGLLAQKLQVSLNLAVHKVFEENSLY